MGFEPAHAKGYVCAGALEFSRPVQIALLVEARLDFHDAGDLLAPFRRAYQRFDEGRVVADAISGHLD